jgi:hypothetical protein
MMTHRRSDVAWARSRKGPVAGNAAEHMVSVGGAFGFFAANIGLAFLVGRNPQIAVIHLMAVLVAGFAVLLSDEGAGFNLELAAYAVGSELLWRGSKAVFWESGKYVVIVLLTLVIVKRTLRGADLRAGFYFALLMPSILILPTFDRQDVAFNLSGPASLTFAVLAFSSLPLGRRRLIQILLAFLGPVIGLAAMALAGWVTLNPDELAIGGKAQAAGLGPNQVSTLLGLGALAAVLLLFLLPRLSALQVFMIPVSLWLFVQTALTLSRGGLWTAAVALAIVAWFVTEKGQGGRSKLAVLGGSAMLAMYLVLPRLDRFTGGMVSGRFADTNPTGRDLIAQSDLNIFLSNPLMGVGPGGSTFLHEDLYRFSFAHTEFTRMLSEHGSFGLLALAILTWMAVSRVFRATGSLEKGIALALTAWALLTMSHSAMRLAAPGFMFGLAAARFQLGGATSPTRGRPAARVRPRPARARWQPPQVVEQVAPEGSE